MVRYIDTVVLSTDKKVLYEEVLQALDLGLLMVYIMGVPERETSSNVQLLPRSFHRWI